MFPKGVQETFVDCHSGIFKSQTLFPTPNKQYQSTEGNHAARIYGEKFQMQNDVVKILHNITHIINST